MQKCQDYFLQNLTSVSTNFEGGVCGHVLWFAISLALKASTSQLARQTRLKLSAHFHIFYDYLMVKRFLFSIIDSKLILRSIMIIKKYILFCTSQIEIEWTFFTFNLNGLTIVNSLYVSSGVLTFYLETLLWNT